MKTFKQYLNERVEPGEVARRLASIKGAKTFNSGGLKAERGTYIPLKKRGHPSSIASAVSKYEKVGHKVKDKHTTFHVNDLHGTQPFVKVNDNEKLHSKIHGGFKNAHVITHKGKHYIADGHHEILGARLRGEKHVTVRHTDLDTVQ